MCQFASGIMDKLREYWSEKSDSHEVIKKEHHLDDTKKNPDILKYEYLPPTDGSDWDDFSKWTFVVDQDVMPAWYNPVQDKARALKALKLRFPNGFKQGLAVKGYLYLRSLTSLPANAKVKAQRIHLKEE